MALGLQFPCSISRNLPPANGFGWLCGKQAYWGGLSGGEMADPYTGLKTTGGERHAHLVKRGFSFVYPTLAGVVLAGLCAVLTHNLTLDPRVNEWLFFISGASAAVLVLRLLVQRERHVALQRVVSEIVGENTSPEVAAMRILEALCVAQGWDAALKWEVNSEENRLEFCSGWNAPGRRTESLLKDSMGLTMSPGTGMSGRAWNEGHPIWVTDLASEASDLHTQAAVKRGMVSGCAVPVRLGNRVLAILEFYCHFALRENRETMTAMETVAASLGQILARSQERNWAEKLYRQQEILLNSVADGICGLDKTGLVSFANPAAASLLGCAASSLAGRQVHELLHGFAPADSRCGGIARFCGLRGGCSSWPTPARIRSIGLMGARSAWTMH